MRLRHWLSELRHDCYRMVGRTGRTHRNRRPRVADRTLPAAVATPTAALESRILLAAPNPFQLSSLLPTNGGNGTAGFVLNGAAVGDESGFSVANAGDVNGDGLDDFLIGARTADFNGMSNTGATYLVFGSVEGTQGSLNLGGLNGTNGFALYGIAAGDISGVSVSSAGDVNGDGFADLLIGAKSAKPTGIFSGQVYVVYGGQSNLEAMDRANGGDYDGKIQLSTLNGTNGFILDGITEWGWVGNSVKSAGDVNGDGFADLLIGAPGARVGGLVLGQTYLVFGGQESLAALDTAGGGAADGRFNLSALDGVNGFMLNGSGIGDSAGVEVSGAGDINGDGFADLLIGAP